MIRHVAVLTWKDDVTESDVAALEKALAGLPALVPEIRRFTFGRDAALAPGNGQFAVVADFDDGAAYRAYASHPDHVVILDTLVRPRLASRAAVQFELPDAASAA